MGHQIRLKVWGPFASFNRPEMKVERVSYDVITPSAARGILEAIYWKPQMKWRIDRIYVLSPIHFTSIRRNEISSKISARNVESAIKTLSGQLSIDVTEKRQQRAGLILRDVIYGIEASIIVLDSRQQDGSSLTAPIAKHLEMFKRRAARGQYFHHPYLGNREFPAYFELIDEFPACPQSLQGENDLGFMLHDIVMINDENGPIIESNTGHRLSPNPRFFRAKMRDGVIEVPPLEETLG
ncbi:type I-C CRISPR-associated protein Cas5c [Myxococcota bacterium]|nr:type I-C CRISPR-associated protein Cas5c [Myxococcota bacterium]